MAFSPKVIECKLTAPDEQGVPSTVPAGELDFIQNGIVEKFSGDADGLSLRVQKRTSFRPLPTEIRDTDGALSRVDGFSDTPNLLSSLENRLVINAGMHPQVFAEGAASWTTYKDYVYSPLTLKTSIIFGSNTQVALPDVAQIGDVRLYTWCDVTPLNPADHTTHVYSFKAMFIDQNGAVIRLPFEVIASASPSPPRVKIVADGTRFWLIFSIFTAIYARCYDTNGQQLGIDSALPVTRTNWDPFDVTAINGSTVMVCHVNAAHTLRTVDVTKLTFVSGAIVQVNSNLSASAIGGKGVAWADVGVVSPDAYLLTTDIDSDGFYSNRAYRITNLGTTPTIGFSYGTSGIINTNRGSCTSGLPGACVQLTGVVLPDGFLHAQCSFIDAGGFINDRRQDRIVFVKASNTTSTVIEERQVFSVRAASRVFTYEPGRWAFAVYLPSALTVSTLVPITPTSQAVQYSGNPTYFILDVLTGQMIGRFDDGQAGNEWTLLEYTSLAHPAFFYCIPHWIIGNDGKTRMVFGRNADSINETTQEATGNDVIPQITVTRTISAVHVEQLVLGGVGQAVEYSGELFMPGALSTIFNGINFAEQGIAIPPEQPDIPLESFSVNPGLTLLGSYTWIVVFEWTAPSGKRVRSSASIPVQKTLSGTNNNATLGGLFGHMTNRPNLSISVYRNTVTAGVPSQILYKVTDDLNPIVNDSTFGTGSLTWAFLDNVPDSVALTGEKLYTSTGFLNRDGGPAFDVGCVFENRVFVVAPDNSVWFTAEDSEGEPLWFSADGLRFQMPTSDPVRGLIGMDARLYILCANSVWYVQGGRWPGPDGLGGNMEAPQRLDISNGCTGFCKLVTGGIAYSSSAGGIWLVTRSMTNTQLSARSVDEFKNPDSLSLATVMGMAIDKDQKFAVALAGTPGELEVWDQVAKLWYNWIMPTTVLLVHIFKGKFVYATTTQVLAQQDQNYYDAVYSAGVVTQSWYTFLVSAPFNIFNVKGLKRIWQWIISGKQRGPHTLNQLATYVTEDTNVTESWTFEPTGTKFEYDFQPKIEEMSGLTLAISDAPSAVTTFDTGDSFALDLVSFEAGIDGNLSKIPPTLRRPQST
jgi:hypothetical protein